MFAGNMPPQIEEMLFGAMEAARIQGGAYSAAISMADYFADLTMALMAILVKADAAPGTLDTHYRTVAHYARVTYTWSRVAMAVRESVGEAPGDEEEGCGDPNCPNCGAAQSKPKGGEYGPN